MAEERDLSFLIDSPEYKQNASFVTACYKEMLERDVEAEELFRWCRQLDGVYTRKALIAALSGSVKFADRYEIKDIDQYRKNAFVSRAIQYIINRVVGCVGGYDKGCFGLMPSVHLRFAFPSYQDVSCDWQDELDMFSLCQMESLREIVGQQEERFGTIRGVGDIAGDLITAQAADANTALITSPEQIIKLIRHETSAYRKMSNLLVPIPVLTRKGILVIFDKSWSAVYGEKKPRRWLVSRATGSMVILNTHEYPVTTSLSFDLTALVKGAVVRICQGRNNKTIRLRKKAAHVKMSLILLPGANPIEMQFVGTAEEPEEITNIAVSRLVVNGRADSMEEDARCLGSGYYGTVIPDSKVRNSLHNEGYSEIECIRLFLDNSVCREKTTRFLQHDPNSSGDSYYVLKEGDSYDHVALSLRLYIAKKTAEIV